MCKRNGKWAPLAVKELVVGDLIQLKGGDVIPADSRVWAETLQALDEQHCVYEMPHSLSLEYQSIEVVQLACNGCDIIYMSLITSYLASC